MFTPPETNSSPLKIGIPNRKVVFQPSIFRGYVSFREGNRIYIDSFMVDFPFPAMLGLLGGGISGSECDISHC